MWTPVAPPFIWTSLTSCGNKGESSGMLNILFLFDVVLFRKTPVNSNVVDSSSPLLTRLASSQLLASSRSRAVFKGSEVSLNVITQRPSKQKSQPNQPKTVLLLTRTNFTFSLFSFTVNLPPLN